MTFKVEVKGLEDKIYRLIEINNNMTLADIIDSNTWDIITFQQASAEIGRPNTYDNLSNLVSLVRQRVGSSPKFYWYQTWAYDEDYMDYYDYSRICEHLYQFYVCFTNLC